MTLDFLTYRIRGHTPVWFALFMFAACVVAFATLTLVGYFIAVSVLCVGGVVGALSTRR